MSGAHMMCCVGCGSKGQIRKRQKVVVLDTQCGETPFKSDLWIRATTHAQSYTSYIISNLLIVVFEPTSLRKQIATALLILDIV